MPNDRTIPSDRPKSVATFTVLSGGAEVARTRHMLSMVVDREVNRIPAATLVYLDGEPSRQGFEGSDAVDFEPGREIEIKAGYRSDEKTLFKGVVVRHGIKVRKGGAMLVVECRDKAHRMTVAARSRYFRDAKDSDVIEELVRGHGLDKEVQATTATHGQIVQFQATDWDMALCRADASGLLAFVKDGKAKFAKPVFTGSPVLTIQYGATVHELDAEIDSRLQPKAVSGASWSPADQELSDSAQAADPGAPQAGNLQAATLADVAGQDGFRLAHGGNLDDAEMQAWLDSCLMRHRLARIRGRVTIDGTDVVDPGSLVELAGVGERFQGNLYVTGVRHTVEKGDWRSVIQFGLDPEWFATRHRVDAPPAGALLPSVRGLHTGVVTKLEGDPAGEERIQVRIPLVGKADDGAWCRQAALDAGKERGTFFRPEIGDEVVVGFLDADPRHGVVLGMLHSSKNPAPAPATDDNHLKGYQSREKMRLMFDDEKKVVTLETPAGNKFVISEDETMIQLEDQNGNKLTMNTEGVTIESVKDIVLKAPSGDIKADAMNFEATGSVGAKLGGSGGTELSLSGTADLKGPMVNIN